MTDKPTLEAQATAVERAAANLRGHVDNLAKLVEQKKRSGVELGLKSDLKVMPRKPGAGPMKYRHEVLAALDYAEAIARIRGWGVAATKQAAE